MRTNPRGPHWSPALLTLAAAGLVLMPVISAQDWDVLNVGKLELVNCTAEVVEFGGRKALRLTQPPGSTQNAMAMLKGAEFRNGTIEVEVAGAPAAGAIEGARGFIGIAFRISDPQTYENIYLRPTNGRAEDQVRRNHSVQYEALPEFPWFRLRKETPEKYESYVDLEPGVWTRYRLVVDGAKARLFVHGAAQPTLLVNDLKLADGAGTGLGLWIGPGTLGHFRNLKITP